MLSPQNRFFQIQKIHQLHCYNIMSGIVKQTIRRLVIGSKTKEVQVPTSILDTSMYMSDLNAVGAVSSPSRIASELNALPTVVKNNASLALIADTYKEGAIYALNGDSKSFDELGFSRGSQATYEDANGNIQIAPANVPRLNYRGGVLQGWLIEPISSNLLNDSGFINSTSVNPNLVNVDTNFNVGPLLAKGFSISKQEGVGIRYSQNKTLTLGVSYTLSCFVRITDGSVPTTNDIRFVVDTQNVDFNINNMVNYGNSIYRISCTFTCRDASSQPYGVQKNSSQSSKVVIFTGIQLEEGSVMTSYIPTTTSSAVRLADKIFSKRPTLLFNKNSIFIKSAEYPGTWMGNGIAELTLPNYIPLPSSYFKELANGHFEIAYEAPIHIKHLAVISRAMTQEEV